MSRWPSGGSIPSIPLCRRPSARQGLESWPRRCRVSLSSSTASRSRPSSCWTTSTGSPIRRASTPWPRSWTISHPTSGSCCPDGTSPTCPLHASGPLDSFSRSGSPTWSSTPWRRGHWPRRRASRSPTMQRLRLSSGRRAGPPPSTWRRSRARGTVPPGGRCTTSRATTHSSRSTSAQSCWTSSPTTTWRSSHEARCSRSSKRRSQRPSRSSPMRVGAWMGLPGQTG